MACDILFTSRGESLMSIREVDLQAELERLYNMRRQTVEALAHVRQLLNKADFQKARGGGRRWDIIVEHLEDALVRMRANLTSYEQQIKDLEGKIVKMFGAGAIRHDMSSATPKVEVRTTKDMGAVERLLSMSLSELSSLTMEEVAAMHDQLFGAPEPAPQPEPSKPPQTAPGGALASRIEHARRTRESLFSIHKKASEGPLERRRLLMTQAGLEKLLKDKRDQLNLEELEAMIAHQKRLMEKPRLSDEEVRTKCVLDTAMAEIESRAAALRKKNRK
jgi:hypothetical protein